MKIHQSSDDRRELNYAIDSETESISLNSKQLLRNNLSTNAHVTSDAIQKMTR